MQYAIETLEIEANKLKEAIRTEERYCVHPEYFPPQIEFKERLVSVLKAIDKLKENK